MKVVIQLTKDEEAKALPILLRHSPGAVLQNRTYVVSAEAASELRKSGVHPDYSPRNEKKKRSIA